MAETSNQHNVQRVTPHYLSVIPRRNNTQFLSDYLREQHSYAKEYASEGLTMWNNTASPAPKTTWAEGSTAVDDFLLGTPVLKARAPAAPVLKKPSNVLEPLESTSGPTEGTQDQPRSTTGNTTKEKPPGQNAFPVRDKTTGGTVDKNNVFRRKEKLRENRKRTEDERGNSDEEYLKRLQERRERKRLKKNIMNSSAKESEKENSTRRTKKGDKDKTKSQTSFALMHGFTATNVGKSRITLEPLLRNAGVFKKGKASYALKTGKLTMKKRNDPDVCFSEARFLNRAQAKANKNTDVKSSSTSSSSSGRVHKKIISMKRNEKPTTVFQEELGKDDSSCGGISDQKEALAPAKDRRSYDPANSIVWDIEKESYFEESEASHRQSTIVLNFPRDVTRGGNKEKGQGTVAEAPVTRTADTTLAKTSDDSLHPSQSASQVVQQAPQAQETGNHEQLTLSKYFPSKNIATTEADGNKRRDLYEGCPSMTRCISESRQEEKPNRSMVHQSPPRIEAHLVSPTLSQMISLDLVDELPRSYHSFSLADIQSVSDGCDAFYGPDAPQDPEFWSRSDGELLAFDVGPHRNMLENPESSFVSGSFMEHDFDFTFQAEASCCLPDEWSRQNLHMGVHDDGRFDSGDHGFVDAGDAYVPVAAARNNAFLRLAPSDLPVLSIPSLDGSSEDDTPTGEHFSQGRSLLYGLDYSNTRVSDAEAEVAQLLKQKHWLPHRL